MKRLENKVVVILGASDERSMGAATARRFAKEGAKLILAARRKDRVEVIAREINGAATSCDICKDGELAALAEFAVQKFGKLDGAINFAGVNLAAPISEVTPEMLLEAAQVHFIGATLFIKQMAARMVSGGSILTTSSLTALLAPPGLAAYAGSKKAADQVVRIAAVEYGALGIRVNALAPGFTKSAMTEAYFAIPAIEAAFQRETPLARATTVQDVADAALWLISDEARATTGQIIDITCGQSLRRTPRPDEFV